MTSDLAEWLEAQGLGQYARVRTENEVDLEALRLLSQHDLQEHYDALASSPKNLP